MWCGALVHPIAVNQRHFSLEFRVSIATARTFLSQLALLAAVAQPTLNCSISMSIVVVFATRSLGCQSHRARHCERSKKPKIGSTNRQRKQIAHCSAIITSFLFFLSFRLLTDAFSTSIHFIHIEPLTFIRVCCQFGQNMKRFYEICLACLHESIDSNRMMIFRLSLLLYFCLYWR